MRVTSILDKVTMEAGVTYKAKDLDGRMLIYVIQAEDRPGVKLKLQQELSAPTNNIPFEDGPASTGSVRSVDFTHDEDKYRVLIKPAGGGSGAGAGTTAIGESLQCHANSARQAKGSALTDGSEIWKYAKSDCDTTVSLIDCKKADDTWINSSVWIANSLFGQGGELAGNGKWIFERGGRVTGKIEEAFKKHKKKAGLTLDVNKWNPADIWVLSSVKKMSIENAINNCNDLAELNEYIYKAYKGGWLKGISLKKVNNPDKLKKTLYNADKDVVGKITYTKVENADIKHVGSNDIYLHGKQNTSPFRIQFRRFSSFDHQGEVKGSTANGGKVGGGPYTKIIKDNLLPSKHSGWLDIKDSQKVRPDKQEDVFVNNLIRAMGKSKLTEKETLDLDANIEKARKAKGQTWWHSKWFGLQLARVMEELTQSEQNKILYSLFTYASSAIPGVSSVYLKVYQ